MHHKPPISENLQIEINMFIVIGPEYLTNASLDLSIIIQIGS